MDYGTTTGVVYSSINQSEVNLDSNGSNPENGQVVSQNKQCTTLSYSLSSKHMTEENINMSISLVMINFSNIDDADYGVCKRYNANIPFCYGQILFINITLLPCPPGFHLSSGHCHCFLRKEVFDDCEIDNVHTYTK